MELPRPRNSGRESGLLKLLIHAGLLILLLQAAAWAFGQERDDLSRLLDRAADNARRYTNAMRDLTAEEVRHTELFAKNGRIQKQRRTVSDFVVHTAGTDTLAEFRSIRQVDGKPVKGGEGRLENLSRRLSDVDSLTKELELVDRESSRYDLDEMRMKGMALNQAWPLEDDQFRRTAQFVQERTEAVSGRNTIVVRYETPPIGPSPQTQNLVDLLKPSRIYVRGRIWIDAETAEIWRYETETMVDEKSLAEPLAWERMEFYYIPSAFGIPTPQKIVWTSNGTISRDKGKLKLSVKGRVTAEYGTFKRFGTDVQIVPLPVQ